nr:helix-turn-helix domain-containing protein [Agrobacterium tumefaciens]
MSTSSRSVTRSARAPDWSAPPGGDKENRGQFPHIERKLRVALRQKTIDEDQKFAFLKRMEAGENVSKLAKEAGVSRERLYDWRDHLRLHGDLTSRRRGRPPRVVSIVAGASPLQPAMIAPSPQEKSLTKVRRRVGELEQKVGQQQLDIDFFREALRHFEEAHRRSSAPGETASAARVIIDIGWNMTNETIFIRSRSSRNPASRRSLAKLALR